MQTSRNVQPGFAAMPGMNQVPSKLSSKKKVMTKGQATKKAVKKVAKGKL